MELRQNAGIVERQPSTVPAAAVHVLRGGGAVRVSQMARSFSMSTTDGENVMANASVTRLQQDIAAVKDDISALADQVTDSFHALAGAARKRARQGYEQAQTGMDSAIDEAAERGSAFAGAAQEAVASIEETLEEAIAQRPLATVGLALGLGFLIGISLRR
jgi:ElaB/YqjD/DUF883 family membrane-anchored ribosome-binding protein